MANRQGTLHITFNGEIYNYLELRTMLQHLGHVFRTRSDTEVILHLYEEYGGDCVTRLNGQFALAIWDSDRHTLFLARDRFGIRPLYYALDRGRFVFASEAKSLFTLPGFSPALDPLGLCQVFTFWSALAPRTVFAGVQQLPPGHVMTVPLGGTPRTTPYWELRFPAAGDWESRPVTDWVEELRDVLLSAVRLRMRADVPVGAYLSGGLDSSVTTALIRQHTSAPLSTFAIGFERPDYDESHEQQAVAQWLGVEPHRLRVGDRELALALPDVVRHAETPLLRNAPVPMHLLSGLVRDAGLKVVVTGEGADEMFAGYGIFKENRIRRFWARQPHSRLRPALLGRLYPYIARRPGGAAAAAWQSFFGAGLEQTHDPCYSHRPRWTSTSALRRLLAAHIREAARDYDPVAELAAGLPDAFAHWEPLAQAQYLEITTFMSSYLLSSQGDRVAMSHGIEGRYPFLDHRVAELAARMPPDLKLRGLREKHILRLLARDILPAAIAQRPKQPYRAPAMAAATLEQTPEVADAVTPEALAAEGCFEPTMALQLLARWRRAGANALSARDEMAVLGILTGQLLCRQLHARHRYGTSAHARLREQPKATAGCEVAAAGVGPG